MPLWEVLMAAFLKGCELGHSSTLGWAAELRALAEIIEQRGAQDLDRDPGETADWLRAEADRAEGQA
jgi:hypothetical protein